MALITYNDKVALNTNSGIADINKVNASDMNEIKSVVNSIVPNISSQANNEGAITIGNIGIEWGNVSVSPSSGSSPSYYGSTAVIFKNTYLYNPVMIATAAAGFTSITNVTTTNVTTTGGNVWMLASSTTSRTCRYLVIGITN